MTGECGSTLAACYCALEGEHVEHVCEDYSGTGCAGRWTGEPYTPTLTITQFPIAPPQEWYGHYKVTTLAELMEAASEEMRQPPQPWEISVKRGGIKYPTNGAST